ncbi:DUF4383 domain-containing protein [Kutzneria kofuensis]|uniref:DUF4383 domain-containing protein n=1 Tax=Kutzneria kofuensis TaxID=103725 RepID=A0A7W9KMT3_9PSEU|nr:DUF4383 domain-containing protein [Kutzneria kofuensis]MBB5894724.1 hypothetical protein [Kutzneria kofuensis]
MSRKAEEMVDHSRVPRLIFAVVGVLVAVIGVVGLVSGHGGSLGDTTPDANVIGLQLSPLHSLLLVILGAIGALSTLVRRLTAPWALLQFAIFSGLFCYGVAQPDSLGLNLADHILHLVVLTVSAICALLVAAPFMGSDRH